jgi:translation initiation factor 1
MTPPADNSELVYSTAQGKMCTSCGKPVKACICKQHAAKAVLPGDGIVRVCRETKGRSGKGVTVITGLPLATYELDGLAKELKQKCGCGGTVKNGNIEIQGDHRDQLVDELTKKKFRVKKAGG